jgi:hypothetical protein
VPRRTPPQFDRRNPLGRTTLQNIAVTGAGQASPRRLWGTVVGAVAIGVALGITHHRFLLPLPLALGAFAAYGLTVQRIHALEVRPSPATGLRRFLTAVAAIAVAVASLSLLVGVALLVARGLGWEYRARG